LLSEVIMAADSSPAPRPGAIPQPESNFGAVLAIGAAHLLHDSFSAFLTPLLPLLIAKLSISLTIAGSLTLFAGLPSLFQPFIGHLAERVNMRYVIFLSPAITVTIMSLLGRAPNLGVLILMVTLYGISSAFFHAPSPAMVGKLSGPRLGLGLSVFTTSGEMARTIGPLLIAGAVSWWTMEGTYRLMILGFIIPAILYWRLRGVDLHPRDAARASLKSVFRAMSYMLPGLILVLACRAFLISALVTFLPTFLTSRGVAYGLAAGSVSLVELAGVLGALSGGPASDRWGRRAYLVAAFVATPLALLGFIALHNWVAVVLLVVAGFFGISTQPVIMALIQERHAAQRATTNGIFMAVTFAASSLSSVAIGSMGDAWGLEVAFMISAVIGLIGIPSSVLLTRRPTT
jgi:FSR family fosmidomycin resistance protein-like MFS transporter